MHVCLCMWVQGPAEASILRSPGVSHLVAVLGIELGTSAKAMCALRRWAISAAPTVLPVTFER